jgi:hypothetical protein
LIVLKTVIAMATPSMLREAVPVAVALAAEVVVLTKTQTMPPLLIGQVLTGAPSTNGPGAPLAGNRRCATAKLRSAQ